MTYVEYDQDGPIPNSQEFASKHGFDHLAVVGVLKSLNGDSFVEVSDLSCMLKCLELTSAAQMVAEDHEGWRLTDEGDEYASKGSPEAIVYNLVSIMS